MKLKSCWKFVAKDDNNELYLHVTEPTYRNGSWSDEDSNFDNVTSIFDLDLGQPEDSLHRILEDGTLEKVLWVPGKDEKVEVKSFDQSIWYKRYSAGRLREGKLVCYGDGATSWSYNTNMAWEQWRKPQ